MCLGAIFHARINKLFFAAYDQKTGACGSIINLNNKDLNHHCTTIHGGILDLVFHNHKQEPVEWIPSPYSDHFVLTIDV